MIVRMLALCNPFVRMKDWIAGMMMKKTRIQKPAPLFVPVPAAGSILVSPL
jgi:hypothetical protein